MFKAARDGGSISERSPQCRDFPGVLPMLLMRALMQKTDDGHRKCSYIVDKKKKRNDRVRTAFAITPCDVNG